MTEHLGFGAFHSALEVFGVEWSYGGNEDSRTGVFHMPPKYCDMRACATITGSSLQLNLVM